MEERELVMCDGVYMGSHDLPGQVDWLILYGCRVRLNPRREV